MTTKKRNHIAIPKDLDSHLVGLWRFREPFKVSAWCVTFTYRGHYYDTGGVSGNTAQGALDRASRLLTRLRRKFASGMALREIRKRAPLGLMKHR